MPPLGLSVACPSCSAAATCVPDTQGCNTAYEGGLYVWDLCPERPPGGHLPPEGASLWPCF